MKFRVFFLFAWLFCLNGCNNGKSGGVHFWDLKSGHPDSKFEFEPQRQLKALQTADPAKDAETAFRKGDRKFVGISGFLLSTPISIDTPEVNRLVENSGIKVISGTVEVVKDPIYHKIGSAAQAYALRYNDRLLQLAGVDTARKH